MTAVLADHDVMVIHHFVVKDHDVDEIVGG